MSCVGTWTVYHRRLLSEMLWTDANNMSGKVTQTQRLGGPVSLVRNRFIRPMRLVTRTRSKRRYGLRRSPSRSLLRIRWRICSDDCWRVWLPRSQLRFRKFRWWRSCCSIWWQKRRFASLRDWKLCSYHYSQGNGHQCSSPGRDPSDVIGMTSYVFHAESRVIV